MNLNKKYCEIFDLEIDCIDYDELLHLITTSIKTNTKISITSVNVSTLNLIYDNKQNFDTFSSFTILHPDGIGVYLASKLTLKNNLKKRITGSDFYELLIKKILLEHWRIFFFGDLDSTLKKIKIKHPNLNIVGYHNGFNYSSIELKQKINSCHPNILIVGMGAPKQERWILDNKANLEVSVILSVGEGIRVFAGNKVRGFKVFQKLGFEWFVRLINNPRMYWKRYILGIPQFIYRFIKNEVISNHDY